VARRIGQVGIGCWYSRTISEYGANSMKITSEMQDWLQIISNVAVLVGLVFVGFEIRYNTQAASAQALLELNVAGNESARWQYEMGTIDKIENNTDDPTKLSPSELSAVRTLIQVELNIVENAFMFHEQGVLDEESMLAYMDAPCEWITKNPVGAYLWDNGRFYFQPKFSAFLKQQCMAD
jgi:hypothetical protein